MHVNYFYGSQADSFVFYRIPRVLVTGDEFRGLSTDTKLLYGLMLDRMGLSMRNEWYDDQGRVFIYIAAMTRPSSCWPSWTPPGASASLSA